MDIVGCEDVRARLDALGACDLDAIVGRLLDVALAVAAVARKGGMSRWPKKLKSSSLSLSHRHQVDLISCASRSFVPIGPTEANSSQVLLSRIACGAHTALE